MHIERCACVKNDSHKAIFASPKTSNSYRVYTIVDAIRSYIARWVGDTESMVLSTYSHLLPSEKQDMAEMMNKIVVG